MNSDWQKSTATVVRMNYLMKEENRLAGFSRGGKTSEFLRQTRLLRDISRVPTLACSMYTSVLLHIAQYNHLTVLPLHPGLETKQPELLEAKCHRVIVCLSRLFALWRGLA